MSEATLERNKTVGRISKALLEQALRDPDTHTVNEQTAEQLRDYDKNICKCIEKDINKYDDIFYLIVITKKERLMKNVLRLYYFSRKSCPTPDWDQVVYKYDKFDHSIEFLWVIPAKDICEHLTINCLQVVKEEKELLNFVLDFNDETLFRKAKELNNEELNSPILIKD